VGPTELWEGGELNDQPWADVQDWDMRTWLVVTRWDTEEHFQAWTESPLITTEHFYGCPPGWPLHLAILDFFDYYYDGHVRMELWSGDTYATGTTNDGRDE
jgi:hypothetical protein